VKCLSADNDNTATHSSSVVQRQRVDVQSAPKIPVYFEALRRRFYSFWNINILKTGLEAQFVFKKLETTKSPILLKEFEGKCKQQTWHASAITVSCDRLKKCLTQATESCFSANDVIQYVLLKQNCQQNLFSH